MSIKGLEKITDKILADAEAEAEKIRAEARARCEAITASYQARAEKRREETTETVQKEIAAQVTRARSSAEMQKRNQLLQAKSELVDAVFESSREGMKSLSEEAYVTLLAGILSAAFLEQLATESTTLELYGEEEPNAPERYEVILNQSDRTRCGEALLQAVRKKLAGKAPKEKLALLTLSNGCAPIEGGVILRCGDVESNGSFELLFAQLRDELETEVSDALFSQKTQI